MKPIKIKYEGRYIKAVKAALLSYTDSFNQVRIINLFDSDYSTAEAVYYSISMELLYKIEALLSKRYPAKSHTINMELHQGIVLFTVLNNFTTFDLRIQNLAEIVKNDLHQKILSLTPVYDV